MNQHIPELLAPAGSSASLNAAIEYGADAVYFGCSDFANARMNAENFTKKTLTDSIDLCHRRDVKAYITVNTLLTDREMEGLYSYASFLYENGADGVIVQEVGALNFLHQYLPGLPLHASTQMGICNTAGLHAAKKLGCCRAVAARELSWSELELLCREGLEIEVFVHGALCACYSGFCLMSSLIGRRSGNRGKCAQPCRLPYHIDGKQPQLLMNLKDLMLLPHLQKLTKIGVASLKIEGRMKGPDYVGAVTSVYRRALDGEQITFQELERLQKVFDRGGYTDGYFTKRGDMFAYSKPATPYRPQQSPPSVSRKLSVDMEGDLKLGQVFHLIMKDSLGNQACAQGETPAFPARNKPLEKEIIMERLKKLGDTPYKIKECTLSLDPGIMIPLGELARVKRQACDKLTDLRISSYKRPPLPAPSFASLPKGIAFSTLQWTAVINTIEQYRSIKKLPFAWIGIPEEVVWKHREELKGRQIVIRLPSVMHEQKRLQLKQHLAQLRPLGFSSLLCGNIGDFFGFPDWEKKGDLTLWVYNSATAATLSKERPSSLCLSPELNLRQIKELQSPVPCEAVIYGRLPLMTSRHCFVQKARGNCKGSCHLTDRTGTQFPVRCVGGEHILYNSAPVYFGDKTTELKNTCAAFGRMLFTVESPEQCSHIAREIWQGLPFEGSMTRGHYYRGVSQ